MRLSPKPQMDKSRLSTIGLCVVVERPDHHCGDDLVFRELLHLFMTNKGMEYIKKKL